MMHPSTCRVRGRPDYGDPRPARRAESAPVARGLPGPGSRCRRRARLDLRLPDRRRVRLLRRSCARHCAARGPCGRATALVLCLVGYAAGAWWRRTPPAVSVDSARARRRWGRGPRIVRIDAGHCRAPRRDAGWQRPRQSRPIAVAVTSGRALRARACASRYSRYCFPARAAAIPTPTCIACDE